MTNGFNLSHRTLERILYAIVSRLIIAADCGIGLFDYWAEQTKTPIMVHAANQLISYCCKKFSRKGIITAGFVKFKPLNGNGHFFPV